MCQEYSTTHNHKIQNLERATLQIPKPKTQALQVPPEDLLPGFNFFVRHHSSSSSVGHPEAIAQRCGVFGLYRERDLVANWGVGLRIGVGMLLG